MVRRSSIIICKLEEFRKNGFIEIPKNRHVLRALRREYGLYYRIFKSANKSKGISTKYSTYHFFGKILNCYYDIRHKEKFASFLEKKFREHNADDSMNIGKKAAFTRLLHAHNLNANSVHIDIEDKLKKIES